MDLGYRLYSMMPDSLQEAMVAVRGFHLRRLRYTGLTWRTLDELLDSEWWPPARLENLQSEQLTRLVRHCYDTVPLYRRMYEEAGVKPRDIDSIADLSRLPILTKEEFRKANVKEAVSTAWPQKSMWVAYTSGTSGTPLRALFTHEDMQRRMAHLERLYGWYTPGRWRRRASFTGKLVINSRRNAATVCRANPAVRQWLFSSHHLSHRGLPLYYKDLKRIRPEQIDGILSPIFVVARYLLEENLLDIRPNAIFSTSETLWDFMRETLTAAFGCKVVNQYGSQEGAPIAGQCPAGGFHVSSESGVIEILKLDGSGQPCAPGELGRVVVTSFLNHGTPLVRYDIGDVASWSVTPCRCGRQLPCLHTIHGRAEDLFYTRSRGIIPKVDSAFKSIPPAIRATQVAQLAIDEFEVRILVDRERYKNEFGDRLAQNLAEYIGDDVQIRIRLLDELPVTPGGKVRAMVNECSALDEFRELRAAWDSRPFDVDPAKAV